MRDRVSRKRQTERERVQNEMTVTAAPGASRCSNVHKMASIWQERERERKKEEGETRRSVCYIKWMQIEIAGVPCMFQKSGFVSETSRATTFIAP